MKAINELLSIMKTLRDPNKGCPWDKAQTIDSIAPYTLEEAYEILESIENKDMDNLCDELGDLLFHIVFYAEMANEEGYFDFETIAERVSAKLQRRHPHVFAGEAIGTADKVALGWEAIKQKERQDKALKKGHIPGLLDDISAVTPALIRAEKLQKRAATVGFDWQNMEPVVAKVEEELEELKREIGTGGNMEKLSEELGDLLFSCVNLARHLKVGPESALRLTNRKFESRFAYIEQQLASQGCSLEDATLEEMDTLWRQSKHKSLS